MYIFLISKVTSRKHGEEKMELSKDLYLAVKHVTEVTLENTSKAENQRHQNCRT